MRVLVVIFTTTGKGVHMTDTILCGMCDSPNTSETRTDGEWEYTVKVWCHACGFASIHHYSPQCIQSKTLHEEPPGTVR